MVNRTAVDDPNLSWASKGLWVYLMGRPDTWKVSVSHLSSLYEGKGGGRDAIYSYLAELIECGYCKRIPIREKGKFKEFEYAVYEHPNLIMPSPYSSEPFTGEPYPVQPLPVKTTLASIDSLASIDLNKGNDSGHEKGLPFSKKKSNTKFPLKKDQKQIFAWLRLQNIDSDDDTLTYYIRTYSEQRIKDAIAFMTEEVDKGTKIGSRGKFLRRVLDGTIVMKNADSEDNKTTAIDFVRLKQWKSIVFTEKYLRDEVTGDDLYFNLPPPVFNFALEKLHEKSTIYQ